MEAAFLEVNGFRLRYREAGAGPPVVFVHGGFPSVESALERVSEDAWSWQWRFARRHRFVSYDRRGCGFSSCPPDGYDLENQALDLELLLDRLDLDSVHLLASSAGGPIAVVFAATRPRRVRSLVLESTAPSILPRGDAATELIRRRLAAPRGVPDDVKAVPPSAAAEQAGRLEELDQQEELLAAVGRALPAAAWHPYAVAQRRTLEAYLDADVTPYAKRVRAPTLLLHGRRDSIVPLHWAEQLLRALPNARLHVVDEGTHGLLAESEEAVSVALEFLAR